MLLCFAAVCETAHTAVMQSHIGVSTADQQDTGAVVNVSGIPHHEGFFILCAELGQLVS